MTQVPLGLQELQPNKNFLINGDFSVWQRGILQDNTVSGYGSDDRWSNAFNLSDRSHQQRAFAVGDHNEDFFSQTVVTSANTTGNFVVKLQPIENVKVLAGKTVTISFDCATDTVGNKIAVEVVQSFGVGGSASVEGIGAQIVEVNDLSTFTRYSVTINLPSITGKTVEDNNYTQLVFWYDAGSDFDARSAGLGSQSGTFYLANVKVELGSVTTPFVPDDPATNLAKCQRYFYNRSSLQFNNSGGAGGGNTSSHYVAENFPVTMRAVPTVTISNFVDTDNVGMSTPSGVLRTQFGLRSINTESVPFGRVVMDYTADSEL